MVVSTMDEYVQRRIKEIESAYAETKKTKEQQLAEGESCREQMLADMEAKVDLGTVERENYEMFKHCLEAAHAAIDSVSDDEDDERIVHSTLTLDPPVNFTSETCRHWRKATIEDVGKIVFCDFLYSKNPAFGELDDLEDVEDEFSEVQPIIYKEDGTISNGSYAMAGIFENVLIVPESILQGVTNEAPPGKHFSGQSIANSDTWSPAPDGMVWYEHPFLKNGGGYFFDDIYFALSRSIELGFELSDPDIVAREMRFWTQSGQHKYWCPVKRKWLSEGEMLRQEVWFHNGDGSANQRRYCTQFEMLDKYGGQIGSTADQGETEEVTVLSVRTLDEAIGDRFQRAEASGEVCNLLDGGDP